MIIPPPPPQKKKNINIRNGWIVTVIGLRTITVLVKGSVRNK